MKEPRPGWVKTRLARDIGPIAATWWYRHQLSRLVRRLTDPRWVIHLCVSPDTALTSRVLPAGQHHAQGDGTLGARMARAFATIPSGPMVLIGSDVPGITPALVADAFRVLGHKDCVFGPAPDGGYWLVGHRRQSHPLPLQLFENVRWSTEHALADTIASVYPATIGYVAELQDVDTLADLKSLKESP